MKGVIRMSPISKEIIDMVDMLPEQEQFLACELIKRMVLAWDSDFTKLTPAERQRLDQGIEDYDNGNTVTHNEIDWS